MRILRQDEGAGMAAAIIDGKEFAAGLRARIGAEVAALAGHGLVPGLAVVLVGADPASQVYVRSKGKQTFEVGMRSVSSIACPRPRQRRNFWR
jgi:5,10-methylene-tetrahydrofolate dehydrogenase/methenyl tetrahydrofolate cyclohydrolase